MFLEAPIERFLIILFSRLSEGEEALQSRIILN